VAKKNGRHDIQSNDTKANDTLANANNT
jgi:hypothetical protein